ncbi:hypothetical protein CAP36_08900 [Chitinophagaceae bacterium IBVUCB2]|nr:hypothetical protein CAP36_08900 [Chitinophagaceae bacterium IBVUCB2]
MLKFVLPFLVLSIAFYSCSDKYQAYRSKYQFKSVDGAPDYSHLNYWAAHPWKWDPSDSIPEPLKNEIKDSVVDVFFLYPTSYTKKKKEGNNNALIDDDYINAKTDYSSILYQASVFNQQSRVFAPRYRQAHITNFFSKDKEKAAAAFEFAYEDVKKAFEYYLQNWNGKRPIIIASHSQGSLLAERLLKEFFEGKTLQNRLVVAYIIGWPVPKDYFTTLKMCADSLQTGCICSWRTFRKGYVPSYMKKENSSQKNSFGNGNSFVTNPLTWTTDSTYAPRSLNKGSILINFNKLFTKTTDAQISNALLYVNRPKFPGSSFYFTRNYHVGDINLYYINIRENVKQRIDMFWKK